MNAITRAERAARVAEEDLITFRLDGREVRVHRGELLIVVADREGVEIPRLCYKPGMDPAGNCRSCMVEIQGERVLAPACCRGAQPGMEVDTRNERVRKSQKMVLELLQSDMPQAEYTRHNELDVWSVRLEVGKPRFAPRERPPEDLSHPAIAVHLDACIQCTRCVRASRDEPVNDVIGMALRGADERIVFDFDDPMGLSTCVACVECVQACTTGALMPARYAALPYTTRLAAAFAGFLVASAALYVTAGVLGDRQRRRLVAEGRLSASALHAGVSLGGHAWRIGLIVGVGTVLSAGVAFLA